MAHSPDDGLSGDFFWDAHDPWRPCRAKPGISSTREAAEKPRSQRRGFLFGLKGRGFSRTANHRELIRDKLSTLSLARLLLCPDLLGTKAEAKIKKTRAYPSA